MQYECHLTKLAIIINVIKLTTEVLLSEGLL